MVGWSADRDRALCPSLCPAEQQVHGARLDPERRDEQREPRAEQQRSGHTDERPDPRKNLHHSAPA